jgi:hypothetical protein
MDHDGDPSRHTIGEGALLGMPRAIVECREGNSLFLDAFVPHRAIPNLSDEVRWSVIVWMMV